MTAALARRPAGRARTSVISNRDDGYMSASPDPCVWLKPAGATFPQLQAGVNRRAPHGDAGVFANCLWNSDGLANRRVAGRLRLGVGSEGRTSPRP